MLNATTFNFPFPPDGAASALVQFTIAGSAPACVLRTVSPGVVPDPVPLDVFPSGSVLAVTLYWLGSDGRQIGDALPYTITLPAGNDSPITLAIATRPSPVVPQPDALR